SHCQRELEVELLNTTQHWPRQSADGLAPPEWLLNPLARFCWLTSYPQWRIVRPSMAERRLVVFCATRGVTLESRMSDTKSAVSKPLSAPTVMRLAPGE